MNRLFTKIDETKHKQKHMCTCLITVNYVRNLVRSTNNQIY
jgi:hypothetical protein